MESTNIITAKAQLKKFMDIKIPTILWGSPGVGKSCIVKQIGKERDIPVIDFRASLYEPIDFRGIPTVENGRTVWNPAGIFPDAERDGEEGIFFMDELPAAAEDTQKALLQFSLDRKLDSYTLPDGWSIVAAGNRQEDNCGNMWMSSALLSRFAHIDIYADSKSWLKWAEGEGIDSRIIKFITNQPKFLNQTPEEGEKAWANPRSWEMANSLITHCGELGSHDIFPYEVAAIVGDNAAETFSSFIEELNKKDKVSNVKEIAQSLMEKGKDSPFYEELVSSPPKLLTTVNQIKDISQENPNRKIDDEWTLEQCKTLHEVIEQISEEVSQRREEGEGDSGESK